MYSSVYLSNNRILTVTGSLSAKRCFIKKHRIIDLPANLIVNGAVADRDAFDKYIKELWNDKTLPKKDICIVLGGFQLTTKAFDMPHLSARKTAKYLPREFSDMEHVREPVYGGFIFAENKKAKTVKCWGTMTERAFLHSFISAFENAGCSVVSVEAASGAAVRLLASLPCVRGRTCLVQYADGGYLSSYLFVGGEYTYSSRSRMLNASGTVGFGVEVARSVSNIIQFAKAQNIEQEITDVFLAGLEDDDYAMCEDSVCRMSSDLNVDRIQVGEFVKFTDGDTSAPEEKEYLFGELLFAIAGLDCLKNRTSLYYRYKLNAAKPTAAKKRITNAIPAVLAAFALMGAAGSVLYNGSKLRSEIREMEKYLDMPAVTESMKRHDEYTEAIRTAGQYAEALEAAHEALDSYPIINREVTDTLYNDARGYADIRISSYNAATGEIGFTATATEVELVNRYISVLREEKILTDVSYTGYTYNPSGNMWNISVSCCLSQSAGREQEDGQ